jgi:hypothetical protein
MPVIISIIGGDQQSLKQCGYHLSARMKAWRAASMAKSCSRGYFIG